MAGSSFPISCVLMMSAIGASRRGILVPNNFAAPHELPFQLYTYLDRNYKDTFRFQRDSSILPVLRDHHRNAVYLTN